jgi:hypothetical protein
MELKDVILSTIAEIGEEVERTTRETGEDEITIRRIKEVQEEIVESARTGHATTNAPQDLEDFMKDERLFLEHMRERLLVLFEGFQSPNNKRIEAKIDLTLNFLEYLLATLDERIEALKKA